MRQANRWDAVLFDLDGTLADSIELILHCYRYTMRAHFGREFEDRLWIEGLGTPLEQQLAAFARSAEELIAMKETYTTFQRSVHDDFVRPYPRVPELLETLARAGIILGVVTSKSREMTTRTMRVCRIESRFHVVITPDDVRNNKPHPEPVLSALSRLPAARPERVLFVGDAPVDMLAGRAAGVRTGAALWGPFPREALAATRPDYLMETIDALSAIVNGEDKG
jgi:pyrophosphatase PpaX